MRLYCTCDCHSGVQVFRLPYVPLSREEREKGAGLLRAALPHLPGVEEIKVLEDDDFECVA